MKRLVFGLIAILLFACSPKVSTNLTKTFAPLDYNQEVVLIGVSEKAPADATLIGTIKIGDSGLSTNCGYEVALEKAKMEARKAGGNVLKINEHTPPNAMSTCDRIKATILRIEDPATLAKLKESKQDIIDNTWNYAKLFVYRPGGVGALVGYDLYLGDSLICRMKNNSSYEIKLTKKGMNTLWAKTESKVEVPIDVQFGKEYYLRCTIGMGIMVGRPQLQLRDKTQGNAEYTSVKD